MELVEQEKFPRHHGGVDYGKEAKVLVRKGDMLLLWRPGYTWYYNAFMGHYYAQSEMLILDKSLRGFSANTTTISEGGRLSKKRIVELSNRIDAEFGSGTAAKIDAKRTLVLD